MADATTTQAASKKPFKALTPIEHDGKPYAIGKTLRLDEETAGPLLAVGAIEPAGKDAGEAA